MLPAIFCAFMNKWLIFNVTSHLLPLNHLSQVYNTFVLLDMIAVKDRNTFTLSKPVVIFHSCFYGLVAYALHKHVISGILNLKKDPAVSSSSQESQQHIFKHTVLWKFCVILCLVGFVVTSLPTWLFCCLELFFDYPKKNLS